MNSGDGQNRSSADAPPPADRAPTGPRHSAEPDDAVTSATRRQVPPDDRLTAIIAPAMADAIHDATGVWVREVPFTPERVWRALRAAGE